MKFISTIRNANFVMQHTRVNIVQTSDRGPITNVVQGKRIKFKPLTQGFRTSLLATRGKEGMAWGILDSKQEAKRMGVEEKDLIFYLMNNPKYGVDIVAIDEEGGEAEPDEMHFTPMEDGGYYCNLCEKGLKNGQARNGHCRSHLHMDNVAAATEKAREVLVVS